MECNVGTWDRRHMKRIVGAILYLLVLPWIGRSADVTLFTVTKGVYAEQTGTGSATALTNNGYVFEADVYQSAPGMVSATFLQPPGGTNQVIPVDDPQQFQLRDKYNSKAKLDSHYPNGGFFVTMNTVHDGNHLVGLAVVNDLYPNLPHVSNFSAVQAVNANGYCIVTWDAMGGGNGNDFIQLHIDDSKGNKVFETPDFGEPGALNGTATFALIPPGTFDALKTYDATLRFQKDLTINTANYPGAVGVGSYFTRTSFPLSTSAAAAPDAVSYELTKSQSFVQNDAGTPTADTGKEFTFDIQVNGQDADRLLGGTLTTPTGNVLKLDLDSSSEDLEYTQTGSSGGLLDSQFLPGTYTLSLNTVHDGARSAALSLPSTEYPAVPHLLNFASFQGVRGAFTVSWDGWGDGRDTDLIQLRIEDTDGKSVFKTPDFGEDGALNGHATSVLVPEGKLIPGKSYRGRLSFHRVVALDTSSYPGVLGFASFYSKTKFDIEAAPPDVKSLNILKGHEFVQTSQALPSLNTSTAFVFTATVVANDVGTISGVSIITPRGATVYAAGQLDGKTFSFRDGCEDQSQVDAVYPDGSYTLQINTAHEGLRQVRLTLSGGTYPDAPHLAEFSRTQLVQPGTTLILNWDAFLGGTTNDFISLDFRDANGTAIFSTKSFGKSSALDGTQLTQVIANGTFQPGQLYRGALLFQKTASLAPNAYPSADAWTGYFSRTSFPLTTVGPGNPPALGGAKINSAGALSFSVTGLKGATYRIDCSSDLINWTTLGEVGLSGGSGSFVDPSRAQRPCFFYRAVLQPEF